MRWDPAPVRVHGQIAEVHELAPGPAGERYVLQLASPLLPLTLGRHNRVFVGRCLQEIVAEVLAVHGLGAGDHAFDLRQSDPPRPFVVQYAESDLDFLERILSREGIFFHWEQGAEGARILFSDHITALPALDGTGELPFEAQTGTVRPVEGVFALRRQRRLRSGRVRLRDYDPDHPDSLVEAEAASASDEGRGEEYRFGGAIDPMAADPASAARRAAVLQHALDCERASWIAESDCRGLVPGMSFRLTGHPRPRMDGEYRVVEVEHRADQAAAGPYGPRVQEMRYRNRMRLIRADQLWSGPVPPPRRVPGTFVARVEGAGGDYAHLDGQGRYRLRLAFDRSDTPEAQASAPVRMAQPLAGEKEGWHFPLHPGTEVVVACVDGDLDRPLILGAVANPSTPAPVTAANPTQNLLRTRSGNELLMDDAAGAERVELCTRDRRNVLSLDASADGHRLRLATEEGDMEVEAGRNLSMQVGQVQSIEVGAAQSVTVEHHQHLLTRKGEIAMDAATDLLMSAKEAVRIEAEDGDICLDAGSELRAEAADSAHLRVRNEDLEVEVEGGDIRIRAGGAITVQGDGGGPIHIGQSGGLIEIGAGGDLIVQGTTVTISAGSIRIQGQDLSGN